MDAVEPAKRRSPKLRASEPSGHRPLNLGTPPPPEAEAMMSIQTVRLTTATWSNERLNRWSRHR